MILVHPNPILHKVAKPIGGNENARGLVSKMLLAMSYKGAGIAAPQIGVSKRAIIAIIDATPYPMINPEITWSSRERNIAPEGCLSLPNRTIYVSRHRGVVVRFQTITGETISAELTDQNARVIQHEIDHLDGILMTDRE